MSNIAKWVMGVKESICYDEHWVLQVSNESLNSTPKQRLHYMLTNWNLSINLEKNKTKTSKNKNRIEFQASFINVQKMYCCCCCCLVLTYYFQNKPIVVLFIHK